MPETADVTAPWEPSRPRPPVHVPTLTSLAFIRRALRDATGATRIDDEAVTLAAQEVEEAFQRLLQSVKAAHEREREARRAQGLRRPLPVHIRHIQWPETPKVPVTPRAAGVATAQEVTHGKEGPEVG